MADEHYDESSIAFLEQLWGEGYLSPGGPDEVARVLRGIDLAGATVLDIGCGSGGITASLVRDHGAGRVVGIDVEATVCRVAQERIDELRLGDRIEIQQVLPGPWPCDDASFDIVFSKDSIVHIPDKDALAAEASRVLRPGGWFVASDWLAGHDGTPSAEMVEYLRIEDLDFGMASPMRYRQALDDAGFVDVALVNRNPWYLEQARRELERLSRSERSAFDAVAGAAEIDLQIRTWQAMLVVLETGEHCPHHFRGRRPS